MLFCSDFLIFVIDGAFFLCKFEKKGAVTTSRLLLVVSKIKKSAVFHALMRFLLPFFSPCYVKIDSLRGSNKPVLNRTRSGAALAAALFLCFCFWRSIPQQQRATGGGTTARPTVQAARQTLTPRNGVTVARKKRGSQKHATIIFQFGRFMFGE
jgi:hypothetical protein